MSSTPSRTARYGELSRRSPSDDSAGLLRQMRGGDDCYEMFLERIAVAVPDGPGGNHAKVRAADT